MESILLNRLRNRKQQVILLLICLNCKREVENAAFQRAKRSGFPRAGSVQNDFQLRDHTIRV